MVSVVRVAAGAPARLLLSALCLAAALARPALAEMPPEVLAFTQENIATCREVGGTPNLSGVQVAGAGLTQPGYPPYLTEADLNGDGRPDYVTDLAGLECVNAWSFFCGSAGCPVTVWLSGPGGHSVGWGGHAQAWELRGSEVVLSLHGQLCTPPRMGAEGCEVALRFEQQAAPPAAPAEAPSLPSVAAAPAAGWTFGATADGAGWFAGVRDESAGSRVDWLCAKGRQSLLAIAPFGGGSSIVIDVDGRTQSFEVVTEGGVAYAAVSISAPVFLHIASGQAFSVSDAGGTPIGRFTMEGAPVAIGQAEGRCQF